MHQSALIIFIRHPEQGQVKTRLAAGVGEETALKVYIKLLCITHGAAMNVQADRFVFYADSMPSDDMWTNGSFFRHLQDGADLGARMQHAFSMLFNKGYQNVIIIGSDCPSVTANGLDEAFSKLTHFDVVIGPSTDGGYYLLGMNKFIPSLFRNKLWSTPDVLPATLDDLRKYQIPYTVLPELKDIDTADDYFALRHLLQD